MNCQLTGHMATTYLHRDEDHRLAYDLTTGHGPTLVFLPGLKSDMSGAKALALAVHAQAKGTAMLRLDYSGHGLSGGRFEDGTISRWRDDVLALIDGVTSGPLLLAGSSMGGWLALLVALARPNRIAALVLIAPAPDFTDWSIEARLTDAQRAALARDGFFVQPSDYGPQGTILTAKLLQDGAQHRLMDGAIPITCPVRILQGQQDPDVPWPRALDLAQMLCSTDVQLTLIKDGDHRLSRPQDIAQLTRTVDELRAAFDVSV